MPKFQEIGTFVDAHLEPETLIVQSFVHLNVAIVGGMKQSIFRVMTKLMRFCVE